MIKHLKPKTDDELLALLPPGDSLRGWQVQAILENFINDRIFDIFNERQFLKELKEELKERIKFDTSVSISYNENSQIPNRDLIIKIGFFENSKETKYKVIEALVLI